LLIHTGCVHRWAATYVRTGNEVPRPIDGDGALVVPDGQLLGWFRDGHAALVDALESAAPDLSCWAFLPGASSPLAFWARRQAHETAVHRVDAELALAASGRALAAEAEPVGAPGVSARFGADGIDELLTGFHARPHGRLVSPEPVTLAARCADVDAGWTIRIGPDAREVSRAADDAADCSIRGTASDLYLFLWNRRGPGGLDIDGDRRVLGLWRDRARIT
ncbi:maleylpyruvate isomerase N-terminal domain-containing protein, partial [Frankia nepalensis]